MKTAKVLIWDHNPLFRYLLVRILERHEQLTIVGTAGTQDELWELSEKHLHEVFLLELNLSRDNCLESFCLLRDRFPDSVIIALTLIDFPGYREVAIQAGSDEVIGKDEVVQELVPLISRLLKEKTGGMM